MFCGILFTGKINKRNIKMFKLALKILGLSELPKYKLKPDYEGGYFLYVRDRFRTKFRFSRWVGSRKEAEEIAEMERGHV